MLLLILSLFLHYDLLSCVNRQKKNFNEGLLMKQHHQNVRQINAFIKEAQNRFYKERSVLREDDYRHRTIDYRKTNWWQLGLNTPQTFLFPLIRSRPTFPISMTLYTTELNDHHLKWDEIFPHQYSNLRSDPEVYSTQLNQSLPETPSKPDTKENYKIRLREKTLPNKIGVTPRYTTNRATQVNPTLYKTHTSDQIRQFMNVSKEQPHHIYRKGLPLSDTPTKDKEYRIATATTNALFSIENVGGILHLRTATGNNGRKTVIFDGRSATNPDDTNMKVTPNTAGDELHREQDEETTRQTVEGWRRFKLNTQSLKGKKKQKSTLFFSNLVTQPIENAKLRESNYLPTLKSHSLSELDDIEDGKLIEFIEAQDKLLHKKKIENDNKSLYNKVKENIKAAEKKKKDKRMKLKADLIRKIAEGSSYSDEEASLRKNLVEALQHRNRA